MKKHLHLILPVLMVLTASKAFSQITGSGTLNYVPKFTGTTSIGNSSLFELNGNVGIGTTSPQSKLQVSGAVDYSGSLISARFGSAYNHWTYFGDLNSGRIRGSGEGYLYIESNSDGSGDKSLYLNSADGIRFRTNNADKMFISNSGNVGIGTTSPTSLLSLINGKIVVGQGALDKAELQGGSGFGSLLKLYEGDTGTETVRLDGGGGGGTSWITSGNVGIGTTSPTSLLSLINGKIVVGQGALDKAELQGGTGFGAILKLHEGGAGTETVRLDGGGAGGTSWITSGKVGIGTTTPTEKLDVNGTVKATAFVGDGSGLTGISGGLWTANGNDIYYNTGKVGIGTTDPQANLHVENTESYSAANLAGVNNSRMAFQIRNSGDFLHNTLVIGNMSSNLASWPPPGLASGIQSMDYVTNEAKDLLINPFGGNVGIGTIMPQSELAVDGTITAKEVIVTLNGWWSDFVFEDDYELKDLREVEAFIEENNHLPDIPSANEVKENGINIADMDARLLQKIEELTLYVIEQNKEIKELKKEIKTMKSQNTNSK